MKKNNHGMSEPSHNGRCVNLCFKFIPTDSENEYIKFMRLWVVVDCVLRQQVFTSSKYSDCVKFCKYNPTSLYRIVRFDPVLY